MARNRSDILQDYPVLKGKREYAKYNTEQLLYEHSGNPSIEALPNSLDKDEIALKLIDFPRHRASDRTLPRPARKDCLDRLRRMFVCHPDIGELAEVIQSAIRSGYIDRNPADTRFYFDRKIKIEKLKTMLLNIKEYEGDVKELIEKLITELQSELGAIDSGEMTDTTVSSYISSGRGFGFLGIPGIGKTTAIKRILLALFSQVIIHKLYGEMPIYMHQVVWLYLQFPHDGSLNSLCEVFFLSVDRILGTNYYQVFATSSKRTVDTMLLGMAVVASLHNVGLLVIDELQFLDAAKSGGAEKALNFLTGLENLIGVPVVMVGTLKAHALLGKDVRQARRSSAPGDIFWRMLPPPKDSKDKPDGVWELFIESLWDQQYTSTETTLDMDLSRTLYDVSQGITDLAVKAYILAQKWAMDQGDEKETITPEIITRATNHGFRILSPILKAMRNPNDMETLKKYEDVYPAFLKDFDILPVFPDVSVPGQSQGDQSTSPENGKNINSNVAPNQNSCRFDPPSNAVNPVTSDAPGNGGKGRKRGQKNQAELAAKIQELIKSGMSLPDALNHLGISLRSSSLNK